MSITNKFSTGAQRSLTGIVEITGDSANIGGLVISNGAIQNMSMLSLGTLNAQDIWGENVYLSGILDAPSLNTGNVQIQGFATISAAFIRDLTVAEFNVSSIAAPTFKADEVVALSNLVVNNGVASKLTVHNLNAIQFKCHEARVDTLVTKESDSFQFRGELVYGNVVTANSLLFAKEISAGTVSAVSMYASIVNATRCSFDQSFFMNLNAFNFNLIPAGTIQMTVATTFYPPSGWLFCKGDLANRELYSNLFAAIGTAFGAGNGTTTFRLPDFRGMFLRGTGMNDYVDPMTSLKPYVGASIGVIQPDCVQNHDHNITMQGVNRTAGNLVGSTGNATAADNVWLAQTTGGMRNDITPYFARQGIETRPANYSVIYLIKY